MNPIVSVAPDDQDVDNKLNMITPEAALKMQVYEDHLLLARRLGWDTGDFPNGRVYINLPRSEQISIDQKLDKYIGEKQTSNLKNPQDS